MSRWTQVVWAPDSPLSRHALRYLWLLVLVAPVLAAVRHKRLEIRLLHLMPVAYLLMLIAVHTRAPHIFSTRYFIPILPVCCLTAGAALNYLGLEERSWKETLQLRILAPLVLGFAAVMLLVNPARVGDIEPNQAAVTSAAWLGWLVLLGAIAVLSMQRARTAVIALLLVLFFGSSFDYVQESLAPRLVAQRGELILYPWNEFKAEIEADRPDVLAVSPQLWRSYRMVGKNATRQSIARIFFRRQDLELGQMRQVGPRADCAIADQESFREWSLSIPSLKATGVFDSSGRLALVRPRDALEQSSN